MNAFGKILGIAVCGVIVAISVWGWLQVPKMIEAQNAIFESQPHYHACAEMGIHQETGEACSWMLAHRTLSPEERAKVLIHRGVWYDRAGRYRDAIRDFDGVLAATDDKHALIALAALTDRSYAESMLGETAKAWADADRVVALAPDNIAGYEARSALHERARQFALAARDFDPVIRLKPDQAFGYNDRCWLRAIAGELPGALADCNKALALAPDYGAALDSRAFVYFRMGDYAKAREEYDAAVAAGSKVAATFYMRGVTKLKVGGPNDGKIDIMQAQSIDPGVAARFAAYGVRP